MAHGPKKTTVIFGSEIPHDELTWYICFVLIYFCFPENLQKLYKMPTTTKMADISAASMNTRTSLVKTAKARSLFFNLYICVRSIGRLFTPKPRIDGEKPQKKQN